MQFGETVSIAGSVALVSELSVNESRSPQLYSTVSGGDVPAAHWGKESASNAVGLCFFALSVQTCLNTQFVGVYAFTLLECYTEHNGVLVESLLFVLECLYFRYSVLELKTL